MKTIVVCLYGGPGSGKSTTAAGLFYFLKKRSASCELVREYVKDIAWQGHKTQPYDQVHFLGEQARRETALYDKVRYLITDSPLLLSAFYATFYKTEINITEAILSILRKAQLAGTEFRHLFIKRTKVYVSAGRYETETIARHIDTKQKEFLAELGIPFIEVSDDPEEIFNGGVL